MTAVTHGPFKGLEVPEGEVRPLLDEGGRPIVRDGKEILLWGVHHRTKHALEVFAPLDGWSIRIKSEAGPFNIHDPNTLVWSESLQNNVPAVQPTVVFNAQLLDTNDRVIAEASLLKVINSHFSWQAGQTSVRGALYDALGLTLPFDTSDGGEPPQQQLKPLANASPQVRGVVPVASSGHVSKLAPAAQAMVDAVVLPATAQAVEVQVDTAAATTKVTTSKDVAAETAKAPTVVADEASAAPSMGSVGVQDRAVVRPITDAQKSPSNCAELSQNILRQAIARAKVLGAVVPEFKNNDELREFYKSLSVSRTQPSSNVA